MGCVDGSYCVRVDGRNGGHEAVIRAYAALMKCLKCNVD